ncbi:MAG: CAP domain-containing protein [Defluviitaleaceae bacterium]|nr:CAP domain-containing protein [Defluviitaleaceae bacterium]
MKFSLIKLVVMLVIMATVGSVGVSAAAGYTAEEFERRIFELTNIERANNGVPALIWDDSLASAARLHSEDMATNNFFSHTGSDGSSFSQRMQRAGFTGAAAENIAFNSTPESTMQAWMNSAGHRANILDSRNTHLGVGFSQAGGSSLVTQKFVRGIAHSSTAPTATPAPATPAATPAPAVTPTPTPAQPRFHGTAARTRIAETDVILAVTPPSGVQIAPGQNMEFTISITNNGNAVASRLNVVQSGTINWQRTINVPAGETFVIDRVFRLPNTLQAGGEVIFEFSATLDGETIATEGVTYFAYAVGDVVTPVGATNGAPQTVRLGHSEHGIFNEFDATVSEFWLMEMSDDTGIVELQYMTNLTDLRIGDWESVVTSAANALFGSAAVNNPVARAGALEFAFTLRDNITHLAPLANLTALEELHIEGTFLEDISALAGLPNLRFLTLVISEVTDLTPIAGLTNLTILNLAHNQISDISLLAGLANLESVNLSGNQITDWSPVDHVDNVIGRPADWVRQQ